VNPLHKANRRDLIITFSKYSKNLINNQLYIIILKNKLKIRNPDGRSFSDSSVHDGFLDSDLLGKLLERILPLQLLKLSGSVLVQELVDGKVASSDSDVDLVLVDSDGNALSAELVDTLRLTHEHDLELVPLGVVVDELGESFVDLVVLDRNVDGNPLLELDDVVFESFDLDFGVFELLEEFEGGLVGLVDLFLELLDVV
jgi:hypothetical protein